MDFTLLLDRVVRMRIAGGFFVLWGASAYLRCLDHRNRKRLALVGLLLTAWMLIAIVRWKSADSAFKTLLWYTYYIPLVLLPLLCLLCSTRATGLDCRRWVRYLSRLLCCIAGFLILLVLTNDIHELVFNFQTAVHSDEHPYTYSVGYLLVVAWSLFCYLGFFGALVWFSRRRLRLLIIPALMVCLIGFVYSLAYNARSLWASTLNYSLVYALLIVLALELCLDLGLIASVRSFSELFENLPIDLQVLDHEGNCYKSTTCSVPLDRDAKEQVISLYQQEGKGLSFVLPSDPELLYHVWPLTGALTLLRQDISDLNTLRESLYARQDDLRRTAVILERRRQTERALQELAIRRALMEEVEDAISAAMQETSFIFNDLQASSVKDVAKRRHGLQRVRMILAYCKRRSSLVLFESNDSELDRYRLNLIASELASDLRAVGIDCSAVSKSTHAIPAREMGILYDCIYGIAFLAFSCTHPVLIYFLGERDDGTMELRVQLGAGDDENLKDRPEARALVSLLAQRDVIYSMTGEGRMLSLVVRVRANEEH